MRAGRRLEGSSETTARAGWFALGIGLGAFVDGILFHQILQWHHMLSETVRYPPGTLTGLQANILADGLFHAGAWLAVVGGVWLLARAKRIHDGLSGVAAIGSLLMGWGVFNLAEGTINHHILGIHRVRPDAPEPLLYDLGFLAFGALLLVGGYLAQRWQRR